MSRSRHDRTSGKTISDRSCGKSYCGVLWKVMHMVFLSIQHILMDLNLQNTYWLMELEQI